MRTILRLATINDAPVLKHWDTQLHVLQARNLTGPDEEWDWEAELGRKPAWRELLIGEADGRPVAFLQIIDPREEEGHYWGETPRHLRAIDIWIGEKNDLGRGYGTVLMGMALSRCFADKSVTAVLVDPLEENKKAHRFYEKLGFEFTGQRMFGDDPCFVYRCDRAAWMARAGMQ